MQEVQDHLFPSLSLGSSSASTSLGIQAEFVHLDPINLCCHCGEVLSSPMQLPCGHMVCQSCLDPLFAGNDVITCQFEDCGMSISKTHVFPDNYRRREIQKQQVYCTYKEYGCDATVALKDLNSHTQRCEFARIPCERGCGLVLPRTEYEDHVTNTCSSLPVTCDNCGQPTTNGRLDDHRDNECLQVLIACPYHCGADKFLRGQLENHTEACPNKPNLCAFSSIGCDYKGSEDNVSNHERNDVSLHLLLIAKYSTNMEEKIRGNISEIEKLKEEKEIFRRQKLEMEKELNALKKEMTSAKRSGNELKLLMASHGERVINLDRMIEDRAELAAVEVLTREVNAVKETQQSINTRLTTVGRVGVNVGGQIMNSAEVTAKLNHLDKQSTLHDLRLAEMDMRFQILETANFEGALMWKIRDYRRRRQEAIDGRTLSLFSQPFYTGRHGYKMCGRVYLNGDGMGKETHLSFFFVLMKGDYDSLLPWPFKQRVSLMLKDQNTRTRDLCDTFTPNTSSNSFKKPVSDMNVASGVPKFITHAELETPTYLQEDTVFLMIKVDTNNIPLHPNN